MSTTARTTETVDAAGQAPGRLATRVAMMLMGKDKPSFVPHADAGAAVEVVNAGKMKITGTKLDTKTYYAHSGAPRGLSAKRLKDVWAGDPSDVLRRAVSRMLPKNSFRTDRLNRLSIKN